MKKSYGFIFLIIIILLMISGCSTNKKQELGSKYSKKNIKDIDEEVEELDPIIEKINNMTIEEKIGQIVFVGLDGLEPNERDVELIKKYHVGGLIFFSKNIDNIEQTVKLTNSLKSINSNNKVPLFIGIDEEGGRVSRLPKELIKIPKAKDIGIVDDVKFSNEIGKLLGYRLSLLGINMDFAPVLDIHSNPQNTVIGDRSYGNTAYIVSKHGLPVMDGIKEYNVIPVVKHFPGHGDTYIDSHIALPVVDKTKDELEGLELKPFEKAIRNGADVVMMGHILSSNIDSENPASLSKTIINGMLRDNLKFKGVVITDDMSMGAIVENYDIGEAAVRSLKAGSDIVLVCFDYENQIKVLNDIMKAVNNNDISQDEIDEKVYRVLKLKDKYSIADNQIEVPNIEDINRETISVFEKYLNQR